MKTILVFLIAFTMLSPLAQLLRTQNPWKCFQLTYDESYYLQAIVNKDLGKGYRLHDIDKVYYPWITAGFSLDWGTRFVHKIAPLDWPQAGRVWVQSQFLLLLLLFSFYVYQRTKNLWSVLISLSLYTFILSRYPVTPYLVYGILGEIPGAVFGFTSFWLLSSRLSFLSGIFALFCFMTKSSYAPMIPLVCVLGFFSGFKKGFTHLALTGAIVLAWLLFVATQRGESLSEYIHIFLDHVNTISSPGSLQAVLSFYQNWPFLTKLSFFLILFFGIYKMFKKSLNLTEMGAFCFFIFGVLYYLILRRNPQLKHGFIFYQFGVLFLALQIGYWAGPLLTRIFQNKLLNPLLIAMILTWTLNIPGREYKAFTKAPENACPVKEQRLIGRKVLEISKIETLSKQSFVGVTEFSSSFFLYELGWNPVYFPSWSDLPSAIEQRPKWIVGDLVTLIPLPKNCGFEWKGSYLGLVKCNLKNFHAPNPE